MIIEDFLEGRKFSIKYIADIEGNLQKFTLDLPENDRNKLDGYLKYIIENGPPNNKEKFRPIQNSKLYEIKSNAVRILCFYDKDQLIICANCFLKGKKGSIMVQRRQIRYAECLKKEYWKAKKSKGS